ncbi:MAG: hypothetical protein AAB739_04135 [Patescibacteria group bacterium]
MNKKFQLPPPWHKDAKWICGIFLFLLLVPTLFSLNLTLITSEENATEIGATLIASAFSRNGLDDETEFKQIKPQVLKNGSVQPIPGLKIFITKKDLEGGSPRQLRINFFKKFTEPLYREGADGLLKLATDPAMKKNIKESIAPLLFFTKTTHDIIFKIFMGLAVITILLLAFFVYFSKGFGRLINPAIIFIIINIPWPFFALIANYNVKNPLTAPEGGATDILNAAISNTLPLISPIINSVNGTLFFTGIGLIITAVMGKMVLRFTKTKI